MNEVNESSHSQSYPAQPTVRVSGLLVVEERLLLVRQRRGEEVYWLLPGGAVEFGENLATALEREFSEELGLEAVAGLPVALAESVSPDMDSYAKHVLHVILETRLRTQDASLDLTPGDPAVIEARFVSRDELSTFSIRPPISDYLEHYVSSPTTVMTYLGRRW